MNEMLKTLSRRSFAANRLQNLIAVLAIALTAVLFTSVTTIGMGVMESMTLTMQLQKGSRSDGDFRNMTAEQFEMLKKAWRPRACGCRSVFCPIPAATMWNLTYWTRSRRS